jgi:hypothetical protein
MDNQLTHFIHASHHHLKYSLIWLAMIIFKFDFISEISSLHFRDLIFGEGLRVTITNWGVDLQGGDADGVASGTVATATASCVTFAPRGKRSGLQRSVFLW